MKVAEKDHGWYDSEKSFGETGDRIFLETRHRILTGVHRPGQLIDGRKLAEAYSVDLKLGETVIQALADHSYVTVDDGHKARVVGWSDNEFVDLLTTHHDLLELSLTKAVGRLSEREISLMQKSMEIDLSGTITPELFESFHIRFCVYFHTVIYSMEVQEFRRMMLTSAPPILRRRMFIALDAAGLRSMHSDILALTIALMDRDKTKTSNLLSHQWQRFTPILSAENARFNDLTDQREIDYDNMSLPDRPIFRKRDDQRPAFNVGFREPLSWEDFDRMDIV